MTDKFKHKALLLKLKELGFDVEGLVVEEIFKNQILNYYLKIRFDKSFCYVSCDIDEINESLRVIISDRLNHLAIMCVKGYRSKEGLRKLIAMQLNHRLFYEFESRIFGKEDEWYELCKDLSYIYQDSNDFLSDIENIDLSYFI